MRSDYRALSRRRESPQRESVPRVRRKRFVPAHAILSITQRLDSMGKRLAEKSLLRPSRNSACYATRSKSVRRTTGVTHGAVTIKGYSLENPNRQKQDLFFARPNLAGFADVHLFGVCENGAASNLVKQNLPLLLSQDPELSIHPALALHKAVCQVYNLLPNTQRDALETDAAFVAVLLVRNAVYCANFGKSRACLLDSARSCRMLALTNDCVTNPASRSEPTVSRTVLTGRERGVLLGSNGLFKYLTTQELLDFIIRFWHKDPARGVAFGLAQFAYERWLSQEGVAEDITVVCVMFQPR